MSSVAPKTSNPQLTFTADWRHQIQGNLLPGKVKVRYDLQRLAGEAESADSDVEVFARFLPEGHLWSNPLKPEKKTTSKKKNGAGAYAVVDLTIPADCEEFELWFARQLPNGETQWDSNFGKNYRQRFAALDLDIAKAAITRSKAKKRVSDSFQVEIKTNPKIEAVTLECAWDLEGETQQLSLPLVLKAEKKTAKTWKMPEGKIAIPCDASVAFGFSYYIQGHKYSDDNNGESYLAE